MPSTPEPIDASDTPSPIPAGTERIIAPPQDRYDNASALFRALTAPTRLAIIELLNSHHELYVHQIVEAIGVRQALVSQHLRVLRHARIVVRVNTAYRIARPRAARIVAEALTDTHDT